MKVIRPPTKGGIHASDYINQWYRRAFPSGQLRYTFFDFYKRFRCRAYMRITFPRLPTLAHPDCKPQEVKTFLSSINDAGLGLVKREIKSIQHMPHCV